MLNNGTVEMILQTSYRVKQIDGVVALQERNLLAKPRHTAETSLLPKLDEGTEKQRNRMRKVHATPF